MSPPSCPSAQMVPPSIRLSEGQALAQLLPGRLALVYAAAAIAWITLSDWLIEVAARDASQLAQWSIAKGVFFVAVTAGIFYGLARRQMRVCDRLLGDALTLRASRVEAEERLGHEQRRLAELAAEHERAAAQLRVLQRAVEQCPASIVITDREGRIEFVNPAFSGVTGYSFEEVRGKTPIMLRGPGHSDEIYRDLWATITAGGEWRGEFCNRKKSGEIFWEKAIVSPVHDATGKITHFLAIKEDISAQREAVRALHESDEMYRSLVTASPDPIVVIGRHRTVRFVSPRARAVFGYDETTDLSGRDMLQSIAPDDRPRAMAAFRRILDEGRNASGEYAMLRGDGSEFRAELNVAPLRFANGAVMGMVVIARDITERKLAEARLLASEERFRQVVETITEVFWMVDVASGRVIYVSPSFEKIWGRRCEELYASVSVWHEALHPEDRERVIQALRTHMSSGKLDETYRILRPDGTVRWIRDQGFCVRDVGGKIVRVVGAAEDVTDKKDIERQFFRAQRLEAIGTLASGVAHDMNNILAPMLFVPTLLRERLTAASDLQLLTMIEQSAQRGAGIVRQLLTFSRGAEGERGPVQVTHLAKEMLNIMRETFPREITVNWRPEKEVPLVRADPTQIHQVVMNLCVNARDAMPQGGTLTLSAEAVALGEDAVRLHPAARPGRYVRISVSDTGHGIPAEIIERIFDPFFTTKEPGKGTGLGLSTVVGIVNSHGGFVLVKSTVGAGSTFQIYLPALAEGALPAEAKAPAPARTGAGELVLVVDDEAILRETTTRVLERSGYRVISAANGVEALQRLTPQVKLVLTDMMMPAMNGIVLVRELRGRIRTLPIIGTTGLGATVYADTLSSLGVKELLHKPYATPDLLAAVQRAIRPGVETSRG